MVESPEKSADVQKQGEPQLAAVSETVNPPVAHTAGTATAAGVGSSMMDATPKRHASAERSPDSRAVHRRANAMKARAGHRRNIRRSNTNG